VVTDRIVNQFLCYLDGVEGRDGVFVMAATSRPDLVDVALLRPGRIDKAVICGFPDEQDRTDIIKLNLKKFNFVGTDLFAAELAKQTNNFTSADLKGLIQTAQLAKMSELLKQADENFELTLTEHDIQDSLSKFSRSMSKEEITRFNKIYA